MLRCPQSGVGNFKDDVMSKFSKFMKHPGLFFHDAVIKRSNAYRAVLAKYCASTETGDSFVDDDFPQINTDESGPIPTFVIGFSPWKSFLRDWFPERKLFFLPKKISRADFKGWGNQIVANPNSEIFVWGFKVESYLLEFFKSHNIKIYYIEDGFIRSVGLGATKTPPFSLTMDSQTPYFNARGPSDLECLLNSYDFKSDTGLMARAQNFMDVLLKSGISKYNNSSKTNLAAVYGEKTRKRVLVVGQVEDDASIIYGCDRRYTNNDTVMIAALENPEAQIIYKPHPDVLSGHRQMQSNPMDVNHLCQLLVQDIPMAQAFETIDHVYTISSQAGFEALMRGINVTTLGCPFYAGWGLTDARQPNPRRTRTLTVAEVFAATYILYPRYFDPIYKKSLSAEEALTRLTQLKEFSNLRSAQSISPAPHSPEGLPSLPDESCGLPDRGLMEGADLARELAEIHDKLVEQDAKLNKIAANFLFTTAKS